MHPPPPPTPTHTQVHVILSEVNQEQEVESDDMKLDPPSDHEVEARVDYYIYEEDETRTQRMSGQAHKGLAGV